MREPPEYWWSTGDELEHSTQACEPLAYACFHLHLHDEHAKCPTTHSQSQTKPVAGEIIETKKKKKISDDFQNVEPKWNIQKPLEASAYLTPKDQEIRDDSKKIAES
eukprot:scaffold11616_cov60-Attheya_sp.AAC.1